MKLRYITGLICASALVSAHSKAVAGTSINNQDTQATPILEKVGSTIESAFDEIWAIPVLYKNKENPWIQEFSLTGRYQGQRYSLTSNYGDANKDSDGRAWEDRRERFGAKVKFLNEFEGYIDFNLSHRANTRMFEDFEGFGVKWKPMDAVNMEVGMFKVPITNEWQTSSTKIITIERSNFINQAVPNKLGGILLSGKVPSNLLSDEGKFTYGAGLYSGTRNGGDNAWNEPTIQGLGLVYAGVGYEFNKNHSLRFDNVFQVGDTELDNDATRNQDYTAAISYKGHFLDKKLTLQSDLVFSSGEDHGSNMFGFIFLPSYKITDNIELVTRYQYLGSDDNDGVRLQSRYERRVDDLPTTYGQNYHALYAGVNYYIYKDKFKVMGGVEYSNLDLANNKDYDQWTIFGALRVHF